MYVVFIDVLGFADAVEALTSFEHERIAAAVDRDHRRMADNTTLSMYTRFGHAITDALQQVGDHAGVPAGRFVFSFSDSAFVAFDSPLDAISFAETLLSRLYSLRIPARAGVAEGGLVMLPVALTAHHSGTTVVTVPFLGSGVVRAYRAESSGKGLRIFVHPSAVPAIGPRSAHLLPLPRQEASIHASHEVNFCREYGYSFLIRGGFLERLQDMRSLANEASHIHYDLTESAIHRMIAAMSGA